MWKWLLLAAVVFLVWYESQKQKIPLAANKAAAGAINAGSGAVNSIISQTGPAIGKWLSGLISGGGNSSSSSSGSSDDGYSWGGYTDQSSFTPDDSLLEPDFGD